ncbi:MULTISPECIES: AzlD domain-containing protein [Chroococcidiopsis]|jgi:branched-subunit amino acid transport protein|uniref:Branched-chain amino acid transport n=1 Tax=Chroococcidiopsis thermalis (strain PCC 7203) TaxID=251229 RepID=K9TX67_CHRTP|nr:MULTISPECIES: AzlD domain-containing protein [Chroococcidiopsis]AFY87170.1 branched-chain amino acid transport [Chroococcidiopsis thermalis PCC 7203]PSB40639.1 branched-chain amino acid transporter [Cyanosarcina cf. burmensis CCALA 770]URD52045.1 AzlD domain-containing protein [Chroococcidiopsis sp. CCNUC1]
MHVWWIILLAGLGTFLMRSVGIWVRTRLQAGWLDKVGFAVILVMATSSVADLGQSTVEIWGAIAASIVVVVASIYKLPLLLRIAFGCLVFGAIASLRL